ncbi:leucine-rich repeat-containing protein 59 [Patella vulgata]|uniref:leucine-rich repeat-containing protein 59 n=1 Tax=Patella vulgata TaxID=6465 RepID=UPI002180750B|nr:leucine-rich repeat-containing protein 59 [Patella vulgata]
MAKNSLRDRVEGTEIDLSLSNLSVVPVKDVAALKKCNQLDLSNNQLKALDDIFSTSLTHLVKIDLSKNHLASLPSNFGSLKNLQHLDLLGNQLTTLPVSFYQLLKLKWLDVKDNPLEEPLKSIAGNCLNDAECKKCAIKTVRFLTGVNAQLLKKQEDEEERVRGLEKIRQEEEAKERRRRKAEKQAQADEIKRQKAALKAEQKQQNNHHDSPERVKEKPATNGVKEHVEIKSSNSTDGALCNCFGMLFALLLVMAAVAVGFYFYCGSHGNDKTCTVYYKPVEKNAVATFNILQKKLVELYHQALTMMK